LSRSWRAKNNINSITCFAVLPLLFAIFMPALYFPILALVGLISRAVALARPTARTKRKRWDRVFFLGCITAAT